MLCEYGYCVSVFLIWFTLIIGEKINTEFCYLYHHYLNMQFIIVTYWIHPKWNSRHLMKILSLITGNVNYIFTPLYRPLFNCSVLCDAGQNESLFTFILKEIGFKIKQPRLHEIYIYLLMNTSYVSLLILIHTLAITYLICYFRRV